MKKYILASAGAAALLACSSAMAWVSVGVNLGFPAIVAPAPVYVAPAPVYAPPPVYVAPRVVYPGYYPGYYPAYYGGGGPYYYRGHHHHHGYWRR